MKMTHTLPTGSKTSSQLEFCLPASSTGGASAKSVRKTSKVSCKRTSSQASADGHSRSAAADGATIDLFGPPPSLAKAFPVPASGAASPIPDIQAACAGSDHGRPRFYFVADADDERRRLEQQQQKRAPEGPRYEPHRGGEGLVVGDAEGDEDGRPGVSDRAGCGEDRGSGAGRLEWVFDKHGKARRAPSGIRRLVDGVRGLVARLRADGEEITYSRVKALRGLGNALDQRAATAFVSACMRILVPIMGWGTLAMLMAAAAIAFGSSGSQPG
ncbi:hypothetical protein V1281_004213 [Nitrobacteraceae bacterium AZCC 2161]